MSSGRPAPRLRPLTLIFLHPGATLGWSVHPVKSKGRGMAGRALVRSSWSSPSDQGPTAPHEPKRGGPGGHPLALGIPSAGFVPGFAQPLVCAGGEGSRGRVCTFHVDWGCGRVFSFLTFILSWFCVCTGACWASKSFSQDESGVLALSAEAASAVRPGSPTCPSFQHLSLEEDEVQCEKGWLGQRHRVPASSYEPISCC